MTPDSERGAASPEGDRHAARSDPRGGWSARSLARVAAVSLVGLAPLPRALEPALALALWLSVWAACAGALLAAERLPRALAALLPWALALVWMRAAAPESSSPLAPLGLAGFEFVFAAFCCGAALARACARPLSVATAALLIASGLSLAPSLGGLFGPAPWSARVSARLLDLSPQCLVAESRGVDWLREPAVYEPVGASSIGPEIRRAYRGVLAGWVSLVVGCAALAWASRRGSATRGA